MEKHRKSDELESIPHQYANEVTIGTKSIDRITSQMSMGQRFFSFEFYPPRTETGVCNLKKALSRMVEWQPQWMDVTWGAGGTTSDLTPELCDYIQNAIGGNCMMHLTCTNMPPEKVDAALKLAKERGFKNILALRGDPPHGQEEWKAVEGGFESALDLVRYIKAQYGDYFGITVSGYPEGHPVVRKKIDDESWDAVKNDNPRYHAVKRCDDGSYEGVSEQDWRRELDYLKQKVEAGGQVIITQLFYDAQIFIDWVKAVRAHGIDAPILPGMSRHVWARTHFDWFPFHTFCGLLFSRYSILWILRTRTHSLFLILSLSLPLCVHHKVYPLNGLYTVSVSMCCF